MGFGKEQRTQMGMVLKMLSISKFRDLEYKMSQT